MRIISGDAKGRRLISPDGKDTRPTSDRVKEALFNILGSDVIDSMVLDLYAGTGNLGLEAISRGAQQSIFIDKSRESVRTIHQNIKSLKYEDYCEVYNHDAISALNILKKRDLKFDIIFLDPPYHNDTIPKVIEIICNLELLNKNGVIAAEHDVKDKLPNSIFNLEKFKNAIYGDSELSFYKWISLKSLEE